MQVRLAHARKEVAALALKAVGRTGLRKAPRRLVRSDVKKNRAERLQASLHEGFERLDLCGVKALAAHLIGVGRVGKAVRQHPGTARERRHDDAGDVFGAARKEKKRLGRHVHVVV